MSDYLPGTVVEWFDTDADDWHPIPGTVKFDCCAASAGGPLTLVIDELGWGHTLYPHQMRLPAAAGRRRTR